MRDNNLQRGWWVSLKRISSNYDLDGASISDVIRKIVKNMDPVQLLDLLINVPDFRRVIHYGTPTCPEVKKVRRN